MKKIYIASLLLLFFTGAAARHINHIHPKTANAQPLLKGKLYLRASIFRGLNLGWLYLGNDGIFVIDPKNGVNPINYALERQNNAANIGKFIQNGDKITASYDNGKTQIWAIDYQNGNLNTIDGLFSSIAAPMPAGYKLTGDYTASAFLLNVGTIQTFTFNANGTFKLHGTGAVNTSQTSAMAQKSAGGTYNITGNTLRLNYDTGERSVAVIGIYQNSYIVLNNSYFKKS